MGFSKGHARPQAVLLRRCKVPIGGACFMKAYLAMQFSFNLREVGAHFGDGRVDPSCLP
jgi:hypothetical protein